MSNETEELLKAWKELFEQNEESYSSKVIYSVALFLVFLSSLIGNILICIVIYYNKTLYTATNYYLFDLAISDLLVTFPILIDIYEIFDTNVFESTSGVLTCKVYLCIHTLFLSLMWNHGILVITALSIERYIAICHPMVVLSTPVWRRVSKIILAIWIIALSETLPLIWAMDVLDTGKSLRCYFLQNSTAKIIIMSSLVTTFIIPLSIMIFVYTMIAFEVKDHQKYDLKGSTTCNNIIFKRRNVNKLIVALTVSFVVCWLPTYTFKVLLYFTDSRTVAHYQKTFSIGHKIAMFNCWFTTVLNPLLFSLVSIKFRKALKILWDKIFKGRCFLTKKIETRDKTEDLHGDE